VDQSCEHENETFEELLDQLSDCHLLKKDSAPWSLLGLTLDFFCLQNSLYGEFLYCSLKS
jgi:hypothetical protein